MNTSVPSRTLSVSVPASTSNLGPGFDCLGLALDLELRVRMHGPISSTGHRRTVRGSASKEWPEQSSDLVIRAFESASQRFGVAQNFWEFEIESEIPIGRGLGSSGAAIAAGIRLAAFLKRTTPSIEEELVLGLELEGHPDNVTASLIGGATLCVPIPGERPACTSLELSPDLGFALAWPKEPLTTSTARDALPDSVPFEDAVENPRRLGLLIAGLRTADPRLLALGSRDQLHEKYRKPLIPGAQAALEAARDAGAWLATLSGSGSALFAISAPNNAATVAEAMRGELESARPGAEARTARIANKGATTVEFAS